MDKIPFEEQRVIDELVKLWQTRYEPRDLVIHLDRLSGSWGSGGCASFFRQVYEDLRTDRRSKYAAFSPLEFKRFLEVEYNQHAQRHAEHQAQAKKKAEAERRAKEKVEAEHRAKEKAEAERQAQARAEERERQIQARAEERERQIQARIKKREEYERRARADFDALGKQMAKATTRAELIELGRKRANLAPYTGFSYAYINHCWNCKKPISSDINAQCPNCRFYICSSCDSCFC